MSLSDRIARRWKRYRVNKALRRVRAAQDAMLSLSLFEGWAQWLDLCRAENSLSQLKADLS